MYVDDSVWVHVGQLDSLPDLALQALGPSPGHRELDGLGVPGVLWVLPGQVRGHAVGGHIAPYLRVVLADPSVCPRARLASVLVTTHDALTSVISAPARVTRPILLDVTVREQAAGEIGPGEQSSALTETPDCSMSLILIPIFLPSSVAIF